MLLRSAYGRQLPWYATHGPISTWPVRPPPFAGIISGSWFATVLWWLPAYVAWLVVSFRRAAVSTPTTTRPP